MAGRKRRHVTTKAVESKQIKVDTLPESDIHNGIKNKNICELQVNLNKDTLEERNNAGETPLLHAVKLNFIQGVEILLKGGANILCLDYNGQSALHIAIRNNFEKCFETLLMEITNNHVALNLKDHKWQTPLHRAVAVKNINMVKKLLQKGANIEAKNAYYETPLFIATKLCFVEAMEALIDQGADVMTKSSSGLIPIYFAVKNNFTPGVDLLLPFTTDINSKDQKECTVLHLATNLKYVHLVKKLLDKGADVNVKNYSGQTPLSIAVELMLWSVICLYLENGANVHLRDNEGFTPLHRAVECNYEKITRLLVTFGSRLNVKNCKGMSPLHTAIVNRNKSIFDFLLQEGAIIEDRDRTDKTALCLSIFRNFEHGVESLLDKGPVVTVQDCKGLTPLHAAILSNSKSICDSLLARCRKFEKMEVLFNLKDMNENTPLHTAIGQGNGDITKMLLDEGVVTGARNKWGQTPLHLAVSTSFIQGIKLLLDHNTDLHAVDNAGQTPLQMAICIGNIEIFEMLLDGVKNVESRCIDTGETLLLLALRTNFTAAAKQLICRGADINRRDCRGQTPLHSMVQAEQEGMCRFLLENGADVDSQDSLGNTPLHLAACGKNNTDIVKQLLNVKANTNIRNNMGFTPFRLAMLCENKMAQDLCLSNGVKMNEEGMRNSQLNVAIVERDIGQVRKLLSKRPNVAIRDRYSDTPLLLAARNDFNAACELLIQIGTNVLDVKDCYDNGPIHVALLRQNLELVNILLNSGADLELKDLNNNTPLLLAIIEGFRAAIPVLLDRGAKVDAQNADGNNALHLALQLHDIHLFDRLMRRGGDVTMRDGDGNPILHVAIAKHDVPVVKRILEEDVEIELRNRDGDTPFIHAIRNDFPALDLLIDKGANVNAKRHDGDTPLHIALKLRTNFQLVPFLLDNKCDMNVPNYDGNYPIHLSIANHDVPILEELLSRGAEIEVRNSYGDTPLNLCAKVDFQEGFNMLTEKSAHMGTMDYKGNALCHIFSSTFNIRYLKKSFRQGAEVICPNQCGETALHALIDNIDDDDEEEKLNRQLDIALMLLQNRVGMYDEDNSGNTPVRLLLRKLKCAGAKKLLELFMVWDSFTPWQAGSLYCRIIEEIPSSELYTLNVVDDMFTNLKLKWAAINGEDNNVYCLVYDFKKLKEPYAGENTLLDFLREPLESRFLKHKLWCSEDIENTIRSRRIEKRFPNYALLLKTKLAISKVMTDLMLLPPKMGLPLEVIEVLMAYLRITDITTLINAYIVV